MAPDLSGKRLQLVKDLMPALRRVVVIWNPANASSASDMRSTETIAASLGLQMQFLPVDGPARLQDALNEIAQIKPDAILAIQDTVILNNRKTLVDFALRHRLVTVFPGRAYVESGGLLGYGPDLAAVGKRAAAYVHRIFNGAKPADMPIEQPTKFELVINLKTAKALGLTIPPSLLARADQVIE
jgi:putative ABC transport system substrate-binding protein